MCRVPTNESDFACWRPRPPAASYVTTPRTVPVANTGSMRWKINARYGTEEEGGDGRKKEEKEEDQPIV